MNSDDDRGKGGECLSTLLCQYRSTTVAQDQFVVFLTSSQVSLIFTRTWFFIFTRMRITDKLLWAQQLVGGNDNYGDAYEGMSMVRKHGMTAIKDLTRDAALSLALQFLMGWG